jgi:Spy/CpxP family protein refolding chaperone
VTRKVLSLVNVTQILAIGALAAGVAGGSLLAQGSAPAKGQSPAPSGTAKPAEPRRDGPMRGAGAGPMAWWKDTSIVKELGLTTSQVDKIDQIYERRQRMIKADAEEWNRLNAELDLMMKERKVKASEIEAHAMRMTYPHFKIDVSRTRMLYDMLLVLTPEQHQKFDRLEQQRRGRGPGPVGNPAPR